MPSYEPPEGSNAKIEGEDTLTGIEESAVPGDEPSSRAMSVQERIALRDQLHKESQEAADQRQRHRLQLRVAGGAAAFVLAMFTLTLSFAAAHVLDPAMVQDIVHTIIGPMVISGLIAIVAWSFGGGQPK